MTCARSNARRMHAHTRTNACTYRQILMHMHTQTHTNKQTRACTDAHVHKHTRTYTHKLYTYINARMHSRTDIPTYSHTEILHTNTHIHAYTRA